MLTFSWSSVLFHLLMVPPSPDFNISSHLFRTSVTSICQKLDKTSHPLRCVNRTYTFEGSIWKIQSNGDKTTVSTEIEAHSFLYQNNQFQVCGQDVPKPWLIKIVWILMRQVGYESNSKLGREAVIIWDSRPRCGRRVDIYQFVSRSVCQFFKKLFRRVLTSL